MFSHVMIGANDVSASKKFYDAVLGALGHEPGVPNTIGRDDHDGVQAQRLEKLAERLDEPITWAHRFDQYGCHHEDGKESKQRVKRQGRRHLWRSVMTQLPRAVASQIVGEAHCLLPSIQFVTWLGSDAF